MSMSCQHEAYHDDIMHTWCLDNANTNDISQHQLYVAGMECEPQ